jgi:hypothetical protein
VTYIYKKSSRKKFYFLAYFSVFFPKNKKKQFLWKMLTFLRHKTPCFPPKRVKKKFTEQICGRALVHFVKKYFLQKPSKSAFRVKTKMLHVISYRSRYSHVLLRSGRINRVLFLNSCYVEQSLALGKKNEKRPILMCFFYNDYGFNFCRYVPKPITVLNNRSN